MKLGLMVFGAVCAMGCATRDECHPVSPPAHGVYMVGWAVRSGNCGDHSQPDPWEDVWLVDSEPELASGTCDDRVRWEGEGVVITGELVWTANGHADGVLTVHRPTSAVAGVACDGVYDVMIDPAGAR